MKSLALILIGFLMTGASVHRGTNNFSSYRWAVESNSSLNIEGSSNVNNFRCEITRYLRKDTFSLHPSAGGRLNFSNSCLTIEVKKFDCQQSYITSDLRKTLKADDIPLLKIHFLSIDDFDVDKANCRINGLLDIALAGTLKRINVVFFVSKTADNKYVFKGSKDLTFADFHLKPPRKLAGLIRINQEIKVNFQLVLKSV